MSIARDATYYKQLLENACLGSAIFFAVTARNGLSNDMSCDMSPDLAIAIFAEHVRRYLAYNPENRWIQVVFTGGEATLNSDAIFAVLDYARKFNVSCLPRIITSGGINEIELTRFIREGVCFHITCDEFTATKTDSIAKMAKLLSKHHLPILLKVMISDKNVNNMRDFVLLAKDCHIDTIGFNLVNDDVLQPPNKSDYIENYFQALETALKFKINFYSPEIYYYLTKNFSQPIVFWLANGNLALPDRCCKLQSENERSIIGRYDKQSRTIVMNTKRIDKICSAFIKAQHNYCKDCEMFSQCNGVVNFYLYTLPDNIAIKNKVLYRCGIAKNILQRFKYYDFSKNRPC